MKDLPEDCLIEIYKYLDILTYEIINLKSVSKFYNTFTKKKFNKYINKYTSLENKSFFQKSLRAHIFQGELRRRLFKTIDEYERDTWMMLIEGNWV